MTADTQSADVVVVGAGPAGSVTAIELAERGIDTIVIEKEMFPRFHIGESLTGECGALIRSLGLEQAMIDKSHPVKHGVKVYGPNGTNSFWIPVVSVKNGHRKESSTWQVRRSDFDSMLLNEAGKRGARRITGEARSPLVGHNGQVTGVTIETSGGAPIDVRAKVLVDASGMHCFLHRAGITGKKRRGNYDKQIAIFTHVGGARRGDERDNTIIFYREANHWAWFIPIDDEVVSVGVVVPAAYYKSKGESKHDFLLREFAELNPELAERVQAAEILLEPMATSNYSYHIREFTGAGFACVGDSHRFIDPVFSFGVHFGVHEGRALAEAIENHFANGAPEGMNPFAEYQQYAEAGQDIIQDLLDAFWGEPLGFAYAVHKVHRDEIIDFFAGRIYDVAEDTPGLLAIRQLAASGRRRLQHEAEPAGR